MFKMCCLPCGALAREWLTAADQNKAVCRPYLLVPLYAVLLLCGGRRIRGGACVSFRISCCGCVVAVVAALVVVVAVIVAAVIPRKMSSKQRKLAKRFLLFGGFADEADAGDGRRRSAWIVKLYFDSSGLGHLVSETSSNKWRWRGAANCLCLGWKTFTLYLENAFKKMSRHFFVYTFKAVWKKELCSMHS